MFNIDNLKSTISKRGGLTPTNRFNVILTPPQATLFDINAFDPTDIDSIPGGVQSLASSLLSGSANIKSLFNDPRDISLLCESTSLPGRSISTFELSQGQQVNKFPYSYIDGEISFTFMVTNDFYIHRLFDTWLKLVLNPDAYQVGYKSDYSTDVIIQLLNQKNIPVHGVKLIKAYPISMSELTLDNNSTNGYQKLTVTFAYDKFISEGPISSTRSVIDEARGSIEDAIGRLPSI